MIVNRKSVYYLRLFIDLGILTGSFFIAAALSQPLSILYTSAHMFILLALLIFMWYFVSNVINFYDDFYTGYFSFEFIKLLKNVFAQLFAAILFIFFAKELLFTRNFILTYAILILLLVSLRIQLLKYILISLRGKGKNLRNILIIGAGELGQSFKELIDNHNEFGFNLIGFVDDAILNENNNAVIGSIEDLNSIIMNKKIDEVVVALPIYATAQLEGIVKICNKNGIRIHIIPDYFKFISKRFGLTMLGDFPVISVRKEPLAEAHWKFLKRSFDIIVSLLACVFILSWMIPLVLIINKITRSEGPVLFKQDRIGTKNKIFKCYKFRTMHINNKSENSFQPTIAADPRVTRAGRHLRSWNFDELPQFINILKGDMSTSGPRPHPISFNKVYEEMVDEIKIRSWVKPGLTGWAQIHGFRGDVVDYEENKLRTKKRIEYDIWYIENWSFWLDIQIIITTAWQMIRGETKAL